MATLTQQFGWTKACATQPRSKKGFKTLFKEKKRKMVPKQKSILSYFNTSIQLKYCQIYNVENITQINNISEEGMKSLNTEQIYCISRIVDKFDKITNYANNKKNVKIEVRKLLSESKWLFCASHSQIFAKVLQQIPSITKSHSMFVKIQKFDPITKNNKANFRYEYMRPYYIAAQKNCNCYIVYNDFYYFFWSKVIDVFSQ